VLARAGYRVLRLDAALVMRHPGGPLARARGARAVAVRPTNEKSPFGRWGLLFSYASRDRKLRRLGYRVIRWEAELVLRDLRTEVALICAAL
jgi:hypothetical protein